LAGLDGGFNLLLYGLHVEGSRRLHRREVDKALRELADLLLHEHEPPELVLKPIGKLHRAGYSRALKGVEANVGQDRPINLDRVAEPASGLVDEAVLEVANANGSKRRFGKVKDLVPL
jgi:hypothetical protein